MKTSNPFRLALALAIWAAPLLAQQPPRQCKRIPLLAAGHAGAEDNLQ